MLYPENILVQIVILVFLLTLIFQLFFQFRFFLKVARFRQEGKKTSREPVSVIICARDEAHNLERFLPAVLEQNYPDFEVIVVNDCSEDNTAELLEKMGEKYPALRVSTIRKDEKFRHGKKLALTIGIKAARHEWLLMSDADCVPAGPDWITNMQENFTRKNSFVLGYGGYSRGKGLLNLHVRMDNTWIGMQYLGFALAGYPYMGVGRNLAYRKSLFFEKRGFANHTHLESGDDDLFVNANARRDNTGVEISHPAHTRSLPPLTWSEWFKQKRRHLSTGSLYRLQTKFLLGSEWITRVLFYTSLIILLLTYSLWYVPLGLFLLRWVVNLVVFKFVMRRLNEKNLLLYSLFYDLFQPVQNMLVFIASQVYARKNRWK